jgi:hypothetical protein
MSYQSEKDGLLRQIAALDEREKEMKLSEWQTFYGSDDDIPPAGPGADPLLRQQAQARVGDRGRSTGQ